MLLKLPKETSPEAVDATTLGDPDFIIFFYSHRGLNVRRSQGFSCLLFWFYQDEKTYFNKFYYLLYSLSSLQQVELRNKKHSGGRCEKEAKELVLGTHEETQASLGSSFK